MIIKGEDIFIDVYRTVVRDGKNTAFYAKIFGRDESFMGYCDLRLSENDPAGNISYRVFPEFQGHGYAAAAVRLISSLALENGLRELTIVCKGSNIASQKVCEKLGAELKAISRGADTAGSCGIIMTYVLQLPC